MYIFVNTAKLAAFLAGCLWALVCRCQLWGPAQWASQSDMHAASSSLDSLMLGFAPACSDVRMRDSKQLDSWGPWIKVVSPTGSWIPAAVGQWQDGRRERESSSFPTTGPGVLVYSYRPLNQQLKLNPCHNVKKLEIVRNKNKNTKFNIISINISLNGERGRTGWRGTQTSKHIVVFDVQWCRKQVKRDGRYILSFGPAVFFEVTNKNVRLRTAVHLWRWQICI